MGTLDTSFEAARIQVDIFRGMGPDKWLESAIQLTQPMAVRNERKIKKRGR
jgi:hypothetical protein